MILKILSRENDYITVAKIARELNVSDRTIHNDLNTLRNCTSFNIERKQGSGIRIQWLDNFMNNSFAASNKKRNIEIFKTLLFDQEIVSIQKLSDIYFVSPTSIIQDLNEIKESYLDENSVTLVSDNYGTRLEGDEIKIQNTMLTFNHLVFKDNENTVYDYDLEKILYPYYGQVIVDTCLDVIQSLESYNLYSISKHYEQNVFNVLVVMCYRLIKGCHMPFIRRSLGVDEVMAMKQYLIAKDILEMLSDKLQFAYEEPDVYALAIYLQANRLEFNPSQSTVDNSTKKITERMIKRMSVCLDIDLHNDELLRNNIEVHLFHMIYRMRNNVQIRNPLLDLIKKDFRLMFDLSWLIVNDEFESMNLHVTEDEVGFLMLHFQNSLDLSMKSKKVLVVCHNGVVSSGFIVNRIRRILPPLDIIESTSQDAVNRFDLHSVDMIISTIPLANVNKPVVVVSPLVTEKDLDAISRTYQSNFINVKQDEVYSFSHLSRYIHKEYIYLNQEAKSYDEVLNHVAHDLKRDGFVGDGYLDSLFEREANGGTEIATGAAVPHASLDTVHKTVIPIWINKSPIKWGKYSVSVIIFFTLSRSDLDHAKELLTDIFNCVKSKEFIETKLLKLNQQELLALFVGGESFD